MNYKFIALSTAIALFLSSAISFEKHSLTLGNQSPKVLLVSNGSHESKFLDSENAIINFWSASDANSRVANKILSRIAESVDCDKRIITVCIDNDNSLASEISKIDSISKKITSLSIKDVSSQTLSDFQTKSGCRCFITDKFGNLTDCLSPDQLVSILQARY